MSKKHLSEIIRNVSFVFLFILVTPIHADASSLRWAAAERCASATSIDLNGSLRAYADQGDEPFMAKIDVPSAGLLSIDASVSGSAVEPMLEVEDRACRGPGGSSELQIIERSASHLVAAVRSAGTYVFRVSSHDSRQPLFDFKLRSGFVFDDAIQSTFGKDGEDEEEIEMEPDGLVTPGLWIPTKDGEDEEEIEMEPDGTVAFGRDIPTKDGEDEEEIEMEPDGVVGGGQPESRSLHAKLYELCRAGEIDDHGDSFACATFLSSGQSISGEIENGWEDDNDVFHFVLGRSNGSGLRTVEIVADGDAELLGALYDGDGQRLEAAVGDGASFRMARTPHPGSYFVRLESAKGAGGFYTLSVKASR